jgi:hypothetical protein
MYIHENVVLILHLFGNSGLILSTYDKWNIWIAFLLGHACVPGLYGIYFIQKYIHSLSKISHYHEMINISLLILVIILSCTAEARKPLRNGTIC